MKRRHRLDTALNWSVLLVVGALGCSGISTSFRQTDDSFRPTPTEIASPKVYFHATEVPTVPMRSVGIIAVVAGADTSRLELARAAAAKGKELGCWVLVEHSTFLLMQKRRSFWEGGSAARVLLVHGSGGGGGQSYKSVDPASQKRTFNCLIKRPVDT